MTSADARGSQGCLEMIAHGCPISSPQDPFAKLPLPALVSRLAQDDISTVYAVCCSRDVGEVALPLGWEAASSYVIYVGADGLGDRLAGLCVAFGVLGDEGGEEAEEVVEDLHLAVAGRPGADADGRDVDLFRDRLCNRDGDALKHDRVSACLLERDRVVEEAYRGGRRFPLYAVAAELVHGLRREPQVAHHRDPGLDERAYSLSDANPAFQFHRLRAAFLQHAARVRQRLRRPGLVTHERHIGHDMSTSRAADHRLNVVQHLIHRYRDRGVVAENHHTQTVADQDQRDTGRLHEPRGGVVVGGEHDDLLASPLHRFQVKDRYAVIHLYRSPPRSGSYFLGDPRNSVLAVDIDERGSM